MGKFGNYIILMSGLTLLFFFTGLLPDTANSTLLNLLLDPTSFQNSDLSFKLVVAIEAILASAIVIGFAVAGNLELGIMVSFTTFLFNTLWDAIAVYSVVAAINPVFAILVFAPLIFLWIITVLEWWRGLTT